MTIDSQNIRRSQFVFVYGPGALIESTNGTRLVPALNRGLGRLFTPAGLQGMQIGDARLGVALRFITQGDGRVISLPASESSMAKGNFVYKTYSFPSWRICYGDSRGKKSHEPILYNAQETSTVCPLCNKSYNTSSSRFLCACINGHLDDVDWQMVVHTGKAKTQCSPKYYKWSAGGRSLSEIIITCPKCGAKTDMSSVYNMRFDCTCRQPERELPSNVKDGNVCFSVPERSANKCDQHMRVVQRQTSSLRIAETITLLSLPEYDDPLLDLVQESGMLKTVGTVLGMHKKYGNGVSQRDFLAGNIDDKALKEAVMNQTDPQLLDFQDRLKRLESPRGSFLDFIYEEFDSLCAGPRTTMNFEMSPPVTYSKSIFGNTIDLEVYPVNVLKTVTAQTGYRRIPYRSPGLEPKRVGSGSALAGSHDYWYPGFKGTGEGLFLRIKEERTADLIKNQKSYEEWGVENKDAESRHKSPLWGDFAEKPLFVWWHTFSHALIRYISISSGYSVASLRERVYVDRNQTKGGLLIYTSSPGQDGSMGGLVETAYDMSKILDETTKGIELCSNDPLCSEVRKTPDRLNGAACHSCLLVSETSCEHMNTSMDRHILMGD